MAIANLVSLLGARSGGEEATVAATWYLGKGDAGFAGAAGVTTLVGAAGFAGAAVAACAGANAGFGTGTGTGTGVLSRDGAADNVGAETGAFARAAGDAIWAGTTRAEYAALAAEEGGATVATARSGKASAEGFGDSRGCRAAYTAATVGAEVADTDLCPWSGESRAVLAAYAAATVDWGASDTLGDASAGEAEYVGGAA